MNDLSGQVDAMERTTTDWADDSCPSWCRRAHHADDHPEDRRHQGPAQVVTLAIGSSPPSVTGDARPVEVVVQADRPAGSVDNWLRIESAESPELRLALTAPSTRELIRALRIALDQISP
jgi:hypothetical protein